MSIGRMLSRAGSRLHGRAHDPAKCCGMKRALRKGSAAVLVLVSLGPAGAPKAGQDSYWIDWNPRYWKRPPKFEQFVTSELRSLVDRSFPTVAAREWRAILGVSLGGFGSFKLAFQHPDLYASAGSISGA